MAAELEIWVDEIEKLTSEDIHSLTSRVIKIKDPHNLTQQHLAKIKQLSEENQPSYPIDLNRVNEVLGNIKPRQSPPSSKQDSTSPSSISDADYFEECLPDEIAGYQALVKDGGRPTHNPEEAGPSIRQNLDKQPDIIAYWYKKTVDGFSMIEAQNRFWEKFREYQVRIRKKNSKPQAFERYKGRVHRYRLEKAIGEDDFLSANSELQGNLADWKELQHREHVVADFLQDKISEAAGKLQAAKDRLQTAINEKQPEESVQWFRNYEVPAYKGKHGGAMLDAEQHAVLLHWIDEQVSLISSNARSATETKVLFEVELTPTEPRRQRERNGDRRHKSQKKTKDTAAKSQRKSQTEPQTSSVTRTTSKDRQSRRSGNDEEGNTPRKSTRSESSLRATTTISNNREQRRQTVMPKDQRNGPFKKSKAEKEGLHKRSEVITTRSGRVSKPVIKWAPS